MRRQLQNEALKEGGAKPVSGCRSFSRMGQTARIFVAFRVIGAPTHLIAKQVRATSAACGPVVDIVMPHAMAMDPMTGKRAD